ncbi:Indole-3-acetic acid-amido synthetase GH3.17 [Hibiscus syriacus]|uniref:Indole-3-acetic acid-amido synthetase GH3.17 n=1 Tax=Hibiscus syriacus TaxID=106335 RepID=A0A6A2ZGM6_HIBSY|nr:indole-3-acetic acid-amido synthetase GH3.17-like [Hibiscus syriacus]KAE8691171.1 Indole-3-acetic acid-amido synthetase GH3.17 [Hibiscus syriacus]
MAATFDFEDGLKMIEELTTNSEQTQEQVLGQILKTNAGTQYLSPYLNGKTDKELFKTNVPIVTYEDIKPYINRIANGNTSNILSTESVTEFHRSSGTSGGQPKLIPATADVSNLRTLFFTLLTSVAKKHFGNIDQEGKRLEFMFTKPDTETPSGLKARSSSTSFYKDDAFTNIISKLYISPLEAIFCSDTNQSMYCQLLIGLIRRDEVVTLGSVFASVVLRAIKFLEDYWKEFCSNIRSGQISDWITDSGCRNALSLVMKPDPQLADSIQNICNCKSWEGIIKKLWPKAKLISAISTGVMLQYVETLKFYGGGLPLVSGFYACSEAFCGINLEPLTEPSHVSFTFVPNMAYFEFLPINKDNPTMSPVDTEPVDLVHVKLDHYYELLVTSYAGLYRYKVGDVLKVTGFHNSTPQFKFVERQNVILSVDTDKTSEEDLLKAVTDAKILLDPLGFMLKGYTSYADTSLIPGHYVFFWELKEKEGNDGQVLDPKIMGDCCYRMEESLGYIYRSNRKQNAIAALEIRVVKQGSFDALMDYYVSRGASMTQYKSPSCIISQEAFNILDSKVMAKFFSPKIPM